MLRWEIRQDDRGDEDVHERNLEKENPAQPHQLVVTEAWQSPADPDKKEEQDRDFGEKDEDVEQAPAPAVGTIGHAGEMPAAKKQRHDDGAAGNHGDVFTEKEKPELHRAVFGMVTSNQFRLGFGKVERQPICLREDRDGEDNEGNEHR